MALSNIGPLLVYGIARAEHPKKACELTNLRESQSTSLSMGEEEIKITLF